MLVLVIASLGFCYLLHRLAWQSSYYADPNRRFCGTLERFFAQVSRGFNWIIQSRAIRFLNLKPQEIDTKELEFYKGVKQFWFWNIPKSNLEADVRFTERREEMKRREELSRHG